jgi:proprotein convertase subtilisin/kexin type 5
VNDTDCLTCNAGDALSRKTGRCSNGCAEGEYKSVTNTCEDCDLSCVTCSGGTSSNCLSCDNHFKIISFGG